MMILPARCSPRRGAFGRLAGTAWLFPALVGCGGDARVELAAATSIETIAASFAATIGEYHRDIETTDDHRENAVVDAFVDRIRRDHADAPATDGHVTQFREAMRRIRHDRSVEWQRYAASMENVSTLQEVPQGLRRLAVESLALSDEARRYLHSLIDAYRQANAREPKNEDSYVDGH